MDYRQYGNTNVTLRQCTSHDLSLPQTRADPGPRPYPAADGRCFTPAVPAWRHTCHARYALVLPSCMQAFRWIHRFTGRAG